MPKKSILIYRDDDFERMAELRREVQLAELKAEQAKSPLMLGDEEPSVEAVEAAKAAYNEFVDEAAEYAEEWVIQTLGHGEFRDLLSAHPPRTQTPWPPEGVAVEAAAKAPLHEDDEHFNVNTLTFGADLLLFRRTDEDGDESRTIVEPDLPPDELRRKVKRLSLGQFDNLWAAAYLLNSNGIADPRSGKYSTTR